jgi:class 3 adenylate cyclase/tetratricopeptide (TPR) repeat protein
MQRFAAALLLADISGFTPLAERLAQRGPAGTEALTALLNSFFEQVIGVVHEHGGDVVKFAGDGLLALWPASRDSLATAAILAAQCGLAMHERLHNFDAGEGIRLSLHSGIGAGEVSVYEIGGVRGRWESLVVGDPLIQMSIAARHAQRAEVVLSAEAWELVQNACSGERLPGGQVRLQRVTAPLPPPRTSAPAPGAQAATALRAFIPNAVLARLTAGQGGWLSELRPVTVLFVNLPDLTQAVSLERAQAVMEATQGALYRFEGSIGQLSVDDKGISLMGALGLPPLAHEDDPLRGVQAAQFIQARLRELGIRSAIGVSSGRVFCGAVGGAGRRQYTMVGDVVNVAARLMQAAPGDILCDAATHRAAQHRLQFEPLPPIHMKGKSEPVAVYRPYCPVPVATGLRPMVGRAAEQTALLLSLEKLKTGEGGVAIIEGEPGIGKSRLVAEFQAQTRALGIETLAGAGDAIEKSTPYHAWRPVFAQIFGGGELGSTALRRANVSGRLAGDPEAMRLVPLLNSVLALDLPDNEITAQMSGQVRADNTHDLLLRILEVEARRAPTVLILEDAHWLDSASWALAALVAQRLPSLLLIIATRPLADPLPPEFRHLVETAGVQRFRLDALSDGAVVELVCERLGVRALPAEVIRLIQQKAQGNPFFSEELIYALRDAGLILIERGECRVATSVELAAVSFPDSVQGVITSRMDRLPPSQQLTLKVASVIGRVFALRLLRDIFPIEAERRELPAHLQALHNLDLTPLDSPEPDLAYIFKHVITQEVAYNLMLFAQRRQLHRAAAEWYETAQAEDLAPFFPLLAHHWRRAENTAKAVDYFERAGEQAMKNGAFDEAVKFFTSAIELEPAIVGEAGSFDRRLRRARWESALGDAFMGLGQLPHSRVHCERALGNLGEGLPGAGAGLLWFVLRQGAIQFWHYLRRPASSRRRAKPDDVRALIAITYERLGQIAYYDGDLLRIVASMLRCLNCAEEAGISVALARAYSGACVVLGVIPLHRVADVYGRLGEQVSDELGDLSTRAWARELIGLYRMGLGSWDEASRKLREAIDIADQIGDWRRWAESLVNLSASFTYTRGRYAESADEFEQVRTAALRRNDIQAQLWGHCGRGLALSRLGRNDEALAVLEDAEALVSEATGRSELCWLSGALARVYLCQGQRAKAAAAAGRGLVLIEKSQPTGNWVSEGYAGIAETFCALWERKVGGEPVAEEVTLERCRRSVRLLRGYTRVFPATRARSLLCDGRLDFFEGRAAKAFRKWAEALATAQRLQLPLEEAMSNWVIGRHLPAADPERAERLAAAGAIFERIGARHDLALVHALDAASEVA